MYLTISVDEDTRRADQRLNDFLEYYYGQPGPLIRSMQACYAGSAAGIAAFLHDYAKAGVAHFVLRYVGDHERHLEAVTQARAMPGW